MNTVITNLLQSLGISRSYRGHFQSLLATSLVLEDSRRLGAVNNEIYSIVALQCQCSSKCIERNIRTVVLKAWHTNPQRLSEIAGYPLQNSPTASQFIDMLSSYITKNYPQYDPKEEVSHINK
ncbi:MAG: sporulation initiation factor Spo0A C-terminal domain-containing protein [Clostridia bacterium]|nr:sporulation initiation factor Spo0A C-terminal domain-containing protein [Clostridia bacterium]